jgi:hypothetical protein
MRQTTKRIIAGAAVAAALAGGTAVAVAADDDPREVEQEILADAADRLGVGADELRSALTAAEDAQLDAAVRAGELTREQADEIRAHRQREGTVLGFDGPDGGPNVLHRGPGPLDAVAEALGISEARLSERLRDGQSIADIAEAEGTSLAAVEDAVRADLRERLDADVKAGRITEAQRDEMLEHVDQMVERLGEGPPAFHRRGGPHPAGPPGFPHP